MAEDNELSFNDQILNQLLSTSHNASKLQTLYRGSDLQKETYAALENDDLAYKQFITRTYGSYENYLSQNRINQNINVYDPLTDYIMDVTVITKDTAYKTDHISTQEVIMENLTGLCTVYFTKKSNYTRWCRSDWRIDFSLRGRRIFKSFKKKQLFIL